MSQQLHQRVRKLFEEAIEKPESERLAFLKAACPDDPETYQGAVRLLDALNSAPSFLEDQTRQIERIGRYLLTRELGRGAMGLVYEAIDPLIGRTVAVKTIHLQLLAGSKEAEFMRERLFREARAAGRLFHPGIVVILDVGQEGDTAFIAMERVDGPPLDKMLASRGRLKHAESLDILRQTAAALDYAHQNGVIHRDIKPANIMLSKKTTVKVADFGIAKSTSTEHGTIAGMIMGTPSYMSPEQIEAQPVDGRSDQFSLAVVAYELLSGTRPFQGDSLATLAHMIVYGERPSIRTLNPELPARLDEVLHRGLARKSELRYDTCTEFVAALEESLGAEALKTVPESDFTGETQLIAPVTQQLTGSKLRLTKKRRSRPLWYAAACAGALLVILDVALFYFRAAHPTHSAPVVSGQKTTAVAETKPAMPTVTAPPAASSIPAGQAPATQIASSPVTAKPAKASPEPPPPVAPPRVDQKAQASKLYASANEKLRAGQSAEAVKLLRRAADLGEAQAMRDLGEMFNEGNGVAQDTAAAAIWFRMAAENGNTAAMLSIGGMYELGEGVEQSDKDAANWYRKAADAGNTDAMYDLGGLYEEGKGVPRDQAKAREWYQKAADLGNLDAQKRLKEMR